MKVRALRTGFYPEQTPLGLNWKRRRGDDTLGVGSGDVFTLFPYEITVVNVKTQKAEKTRMLSIDEQIADWMEPVDDHIPEKTTGNKDALRAKTNDIAALHRPGV